MKNASKWVIMMILSTIASFSLDANAATQQPVVSVAEKSFPTVEKLEVYWQALLANPKAGGRIDAQKIELDLLGAGIWGKAQEKPETPQNAGIRQLVKELIGSTIAARHGLTVSDGWVSKNELALVAQTTGVSGFSYDELQEIVMTAQRLYNTTEVERLSSLATEADADRNKLRQADVRLRARASDLEEGQATLTTKVAELVGRMDAAESNLDELRTDYDASQLATQEWRAGSEAGLAAVKKTADGGVTAAAAAQGTADAAQQQADLANNRINVVEENVINTNTNLSIVVWCVGILAIVVLGLVVIFVYRYIRSRRQMTGLPAVEKDLQVVKQQVKDVQQDVSGLQAVHGEINGLTSGFAELVEKLTAAGGVADDKPAAQPEVRIPTLTAVVGDHTEFDPLEVTQGIEISPLVAGEQGDQDHSGQARTTSDEEELLAKAARLVDEKEETEAA